MTTLYISRLVKLAEQAAEANAAAFDAASSVLVATLTGDGLIHLYGSGHSVLPAQETYPRYGSYLGFNPLTDPRVMWHNVLGAGGVRELLWLERTEGYAEKFLDHQPLIRVTASSFSATAAATPPASTRRSTVRSAD